MVRRPSDGLTRSTFNRNAWIISRSIAGIWPFWQRKETTEQIEAGRGYFFRIIEIDIYEHMFYNACEEQMFSYGGVV